MPSEESMIEDLRELESELREKEEYRKANIIDLFIRYSTHCKINKSLIKEKIEELRNKLKELRDEFINNEEYTTEKWLFDQQLIMEKITVLEELLKGE